MKKSKVSKELWVFNNSSNDVSVSDLGVKILAGESINLYVSNPYLTEEQVEKSMKYGSLLKRLGGENPVLKVVKKKVSNEKTKVRKIAQSKEPIMATKRNSTVIIEQKTADEVTDDKGFDFADYGVDTSISAPTKDGVGVVIKAKEDLAEIPVVKKDLADSQEKQSNPLGKMVEVAIPSNSFAVVRPEPNETIAKKSLEVLEVTKIKEPVKVGRVETEQSEAKIEMSQIKSEELVAIKKECGVVIENKTEVETPKPKEEVGMRVASRTKSGITVMKIKE